MSPATTVDRVCVIGAGSSGIAACQSLGAKGIPYDCFEKGTQVGGNWRYRNDNGQSAAYRSLHINTSRRVMEFREFPMPDDLPDFPSHFQIAAYFDDYVEHFGLREHIRFATEVLRVEPVGDGSWDVTTRPVAPVAPDDDTGVPEPPAPAGPESTTRYRAVVVANGHHWDARWPEPGFPGQDDFAGEQVHAHTYDTADTLRGKRVLVLGIGNSATDIAVESSRIAERTFLAMRRSAYVIPKYVFGTPMDELQGSLASKVHVPLAVQRVSAGFLLRLTVGRMTDYGLQEPDHKILAAHPTISSELLGRIGHGDIGVKPNIEAFVGGRTVRFVDGTEEELDLVVYCTGYRISFPFLAESVVPTADNHVPLYRRVVAPDRPGLFFVGLLQPIGAVMPLAEAQSQWIAALLTGETTLPSPEAMRRAIADEEAAMNRQYLSSKRHTIQVDFHDYLRLLARERRLGPAAAEAVGPLRRVQRVARRVRSLAGTSA
ncbi:NAD(P)/FAD-dependent oxidoreductase [Patulibacter sp.]|uniref:flavin-containing monooxygenase n=1 Tax=Patulibacter sp. TaxID=1912859 RepID=UPI002717F41E|nr:FAD-dependent oxidoreductase [Patulibacter sp.]MDO9410569.1 FAD-dependent oxidoreductase [Patulibacter sp.]